MAWTSAWTRPDVFRAVAGLSVVFGGRGLIGLPGDPLGERRPNLVERELAGPDLLFYQEPGTGMRDRMPPVPDPLPGWFTEADVDCYAAEFERTGFEGGLNYYRNVDLDWELLAPYEGRPVSVPSVFIGGDRDVATVWAKEAIALLPKTQSDLRGVHIVRDAGHWLQQEQPDAVNALLSSCGASSSCRREAVPSPGWLPLDYSSKSFNRSARSFG